MKRKKILHIISNLDVAGAQTVVMNYLRQLSNDPEFDIHVAVAGVYKDSAYEQECKEKGYNVSYCEYTPWIGIPIIRAFVNWIKLQLAIYKKIKRVKPDIVHSHLTGILPFVTLPFIFSGVKNRFHTLHSDPYAIRKDFVRWARFAFKRCGIYPVCVTGDQAEKAKKRYGINELTIIPNGLDLQKYNISESQVSIRTSIGITQDAFVVGCVSRLDKIKNFEFFVNVFAELKKRNSNALMLLVGEGPEKQNIVKWAKECGFDGSIVFTGLRKDVERMYKAMDVFMLTSFSESSSIVTVEAQLSGIRCVVSSGVPSNVVITNQVNRLSLQEPIEMWVDALSNNLSKEIIIYPAENFSLSTSIKKIKELYNKSLKIYKE